MITKNEFEHFEDVRKSGLTNMYDVGRVGTLMLKRGFFMSDEKIVEIMKNYDKLSKKYAK